MRRYTVSIARATSAVAQFPRTAVREVEATNPGFALRQFVSQSGLRLHKGEAVHVTIADQGEIEREPCPRTCTAATIPEGDQRAEPAIHACGAPCAGLERHTSVHRCAEHAR